MSARATIAAWPVAGAPAEGGLIITGAAEIAATSRADREKKSEQNPQSAMPKEGHDDR